MPQKRVQRVRHTTSAANTFTGLEGEITVDKTKKTLRVHDGATPGGSEIALADASNIQAASNSQDGKATAAQISQQETNTAAIATNAANIATNSTDIATNATGIATNATNIAANATAITGKAATAHSHNADEINKGDSLYDNSTALDVKLKAASGLAGDGDGVYVDVDTLPDITDPPALSVKTIIHDGANKASSLSLAGLALTELVTPAAAYKNLICKYASATTCDIDADYIIVSATDNKKKLLLAVDLTVAITASGANGLDTGTEASDTWYYLWVIHNPTTVTTAGLLSLSATSPTMPSGYTYKTLVGAVRNNGSNDFINFHQIGYQVWIERQDIFATQAGVTSWTSQSVAARVPAIANVVRGMLGHNSTANRNHGVASNSAGTLGQVVGGGGSVNGIDGMAAALEFEIPLITAQTIWWQTQTTDSIFILRITGFDLPI